MSAGGVAGGSDGRGGEGDKLDEAIARLLFPEFNEVPYAD